MKTNTHHHKPFHLHLEYFFRKQYVLLAVLVLLMVAVIKSDGRVISLWRQAYAQGFGMVGQYMREETTRIPLTFEGPSHVQTVSGR